MAGSTSSLSQDLNGVDEDPSFWCLQESIPRLMRIKEEIERATATAASMKPPAQHYNSRFSFPAKKPMVVKKKTKKVCRMKPMVVKKKTKKVCREFIAHNCVRMHLDLKCSSCVWLHGPGGAYVEQGKQA